MHVVTGRILLDEWRGEPGPATVYVRLLDTSLIDAPARTVDEAVLHDVRLDRAVDDGIEFRVVAKELDSRARYQVSVLVDLDGDGKIRQMRIKVEKGKGRFVIDPRDPKGRLMKSSDKGEGNYNIMSEGIDNDGDWDPLTDDVGLDGDPVFGPQALVEVVLDAFDLEPITLID